MEGSGVTIPSMSGYKPSCLHKSDLTVTGNLPMFAIDCEMVCAREYMLAGCHVMALNIGRWQ